MTRDEAIYPFSSVSANWPFLDFTNASLFDVWFDTLKKFDISEVRTGINDMIANEKNTPTVALAREYVEKVRAANRREEQDHNLRVLWSNSVSCRKCNDFGYTLRIYPTGYEYVIPCDCARARERFTEKWRTGKEVPFSRDKMTILFGKDSDEGWKLVKYVPKEPHKEIVWKYEEASKT